MIFVKLAERAGRAVYNPEARRRYYENKKEYNLEYSRIYNLQRKFNLTPEQYQIMVDKQNGVCAICKGTCSRKLAVDHDHKTGKVRGLLCNSCNRGLGYLKDNKENLQNALEYLNGQ